MTQTKESKDPLPGLLLVGAAVLAAYGAKTLLPGAGLGVVVWAILAGILLNTVWRPGASYETGIRFCEKRILEIGIVLLGAGLELQILGKLDPKTMAVILAAMIATIAAAPLVARVMGLPRSYGLLIGIGTSVCGSAAIAAVSPALAKDRAETAFSIAVINVIGLGTMAVLVWYVRAFGLGVGPAALLLGGGLPSVGHAVGAGYAVGNEVGALTVMVKLGRVLFLIPLVVAVNTFIAAKNRTKESPSLWRSIPWFVPAFLGMVAVRSAGWLTSPQFVIVSGAGQAALVAGMAAIGLRVDLGSVRSRGPRAFALGIILAFLYTGAVLAGASLFS